MLTCMRLLRHSSSAGLPEVYISIFKRCPTVDNAGALREVLVRQLSNVMSLLCVHAGAAGAAKRKADSTTTEDNQTAHKAVRTTGQCALLSPAMCCAAEAILAWLSV